MNRDREQDGADRPVAPDDEPVANKQVAHDDASPHDAVGAYVLDALPEDERLAFAAHLASCLECQREVAELQPVVSLLPRLLELDPVPAFAGDVAAIGRQPNPSRNLRGRILTAVREEETADHLETPVEEPPGTPEMTPAVEPDLDAEPVAVDAEPESATAPEIDGAPAEPAPQPAPATLPTRPPGRIRPGAPPEVKPTPLWQSVARRERSWLAAAVLAVVAVGAIIWALALQGRVGDKDDEVAVLQREVATQEAQLDELREAGNASVAQLGPTDEGPDAASGRLFIPLSQEEGVLLVDGLAELPSERIYQLWFIAGETPQPGPTFRVGEDGRGTVIVPSDAPTFDAVGITEEPEEGSQEPTTPVLLVGQLGGARG